MGEQRRVLGIDIGATSVKIGLLDADSGGVVDVRKVDMITGAPDLMVDRIARTALGYKPDLVGAGSPGTVNHVTGLVNCSNLKWVDVPLSAMLEERLGLPVWVDNDAKSALVAEWYSGVCKDARCALCITLGTGIGGALLIDGQPWKGHDNTAFGLSNIITHGGQYIPGSEAKEGRFEYYASGKALSRMAGGRPTYEVIEGVLHREAWALGPFDVFIHELGLGIMTLCTIFKPDVIALGGGICVTGDYLLDGIRKKVAALRADRHSGYAVKIYLARHQNDAGMIGAAVLASRNL